MQKEPSSNTPKRPGSRDSEAVSVHLRNCCEETIELLSKNNPMMVCQECKQMIKVFSEEADYRNYVRFCNSRNRTIYTCTYSGLKVVVYQAYNSFGR